MLLCPECGEQNQIGRVFCASCGTKLNLEGVTSDAVSAHVSVPWWKRYWKWLAPIPVVLVLIPISLRLWPKVERIGAAGTPVGRMRVIRAMELIRSISDGSSEATSAEVSISEADLNAYLRYEVEQKLGVRVSVDVLDGVLLVRVVKPRFSWGLPKEYRFEPDISYDVTCVAQGGRVVPYKVRIGHTAAGLSKGSALKRLRRMFSGVSGGKVLAMAELAGLISCRDGVLSRGLVDLRGRRYRACSGWFQGVGAR